MFAFLIAAGAVSQTNAGNDCVSAINWPALSIRVRHDGQGRVLTGIEGVSHARCGGSC